MSRWDLARARQQQPARKYRPCGPVGPTPGELEEMKWTRALNNTRVAMLANPDYDAVICSPRDAERLKVLGLRLILNSYVPKGEWSLYATPPTTAWQRSPTLGHLDCIAPPVGINSVVRGDTPYRCYTCQRGEPCIYKMAGLKACAEMTP